MQLDGEKVRRGRLLLGYGAQAAADVASVSKNSFLRAERGDDLRPGTARKIAQALRVPLAELLEGDPPKERRSSLEPPLFNGVEDERHEEEEFLAARRYLIPLMDSYALIFSDLSKGHGARIANLAEDLPPSRVLVVYQWVREFLSTCDLMEHALLEKGVMEAVISLIDREQAEEGSVPGDLLQRARVFQQAWTKLFVDTWTAANEWVQAQAARPEVMEYSNREKEAADRQLEKATGLAYLDHRRRRRASPASPWTTRAEGAG